jgi:hypothetical protein
MRAKITRYTLATVGAGALLCLHGAQQRISALQRWAEQQTETVKVEAAQKPSPFHNDRLKRITLPDRPITVFDGFAGVTGMLLPESTDPKKELVFPEQVRITCTRNSLYPEHKQGECAVISQSLGVMGGIVMVNDPEEDQYEITQWDTHGLVASYTDDSSSKCQLHILTMAFQAGAVSISDIPTHKKGCEAFVETNSYRLVRGQYYVDTSPNNDGDKPYPTKSK